ncbi:MAG: tRNA-dihydrouridine synthase [Candidatus Paceibacterota bacterium]
MSFWEKIKKPIIALAPMADVTDVAFRKIIAKYGKPDVLWTEFVSADGLCFAPRSASRSGVGGKEQLIKDLKFDESERPIVVQFFTSNPETIEEAARLAAEMGFDGIDINMGCPDKSIEKQKAGAALMKNPKLAKEIIYAAKRGAGNVPVSVKTRIGFNKNELESWLPEILETEPVAIIVHARTRKEMSKVPANWDFVKRAVEIRDERKSKTLILGNGDVNNLSEAFQRVRETGCDGVMIGRGIFGNPWLFANLEKFKNVQEVEDASVETSEKLKVLVEHTKLFEKLVSHKNFAVMKKHFKAYVNGFDGAKELRMQLMEAENADEVEKIIENFIDKSK